MESAIEELLAGQQSTIQLKILVVDEHDSCKKFQKAGELIENIVKSFTKAMELLHPTKADSSSKNDDVLSFCSDNSNNSSSPIKKCRRGSYKRKREEATWSILSSTLYDGHSWRKYGQKVIRNCKFPKSYFRCSRKYDHGCKAIKYAQIVDENPRMCKTTYIGQHTCKEINKVSPIISSRKTLGSMKGNESSTNMFSALDVTGDRNEVLPVQYSQSSLYELDKDMVDMLKMNSGLSFYEVLQEPSCG